MAITAHDIVPDSPTNNFCTLNPLAQFGSPSISEGNLEISLQATSADGCFASMLPVTQKYYWETLLFSGIQGYGLMENTSNAYNDHHTVYYTDGRIYVNGSLITNGATTATSGDVIGVAFDPVAQTIQFFKNNSLIGSYSTTGNGLLPSVVGTGNGAGVTVANFGQDPTFAGNKNTPATVNINGTNVTGPFAPSGDAAGTAGLFYYPPPAGAKALCTANLPDFTPTVTGDTPQDYFKTLTYTGSTTQTTTLDFNSFTPDLLWIKNRYDSASTSISHALIDSVRGGDKVLASDSSSNESVVSSAVTFNNDNTVSLLAGYSRINNAANSRTYVAWGWKSGGSPSGSTSTTGSAKRINTSGTQDDTSCSALATAATNAGASNVITPTLMSINQAAGFSIVKYTGTGSAATVPHGLSSAPEMIIVKNLDDTTARDWQVYHHKNTSEPATDYLRLNETGGTSDNIVIWNDTEPTSSVFTVGVNATVNSDGYNHIAYCWHSVENYSKCGSYTGNGLADGPFVACGFRPAFVMIKNTDDSNSWMILDNQRSPHNLSHQAIRAESSGTEITNQATNYGTDILSNGFVPRTSGGAGTNSNNATSDTYIFMAFAEQPFKFSNAR